MPSVELLQWAHATVRSRAEGEAVFARWFDAQGEVSETHTFESLWQEAGRIAHELRVSWGLAKGDRAVLCYGFGLDFFAAFLGCLRAGVLAVPVYPPSPLTLSKSLAKLQGVVDACSPRVVLLSADVNRLRLASKLNFLSSARRLWPDLPYETLGSSAVSNTVGGEGEAGGGGQSSTWFGYGGDGGGAGVKCFDDDSLEEDDVAFLQFTSGSTSEPKGVMVTFANLMHNVTYISRKAERTFESRGFPEGERVRGFSWLPQYHDLGLIMCTLTPFVSGWRMGYMSPLDFVRRPLLWLRLLSAERALFGCVPDFSLRLCVRKWNEATPETRASLSESVDLSDLKWIQNGAEPIRASSIRDFAATFAALGLSPAYAGTAYGLAEHVVGVCGQEANQGGLPLSDLSDEDLECVGHVDYLSEGSQLAIVDPETRREMPRGETGEVWLSSPSVAAGYWGRPELTEEAFSARIAGEDGADSDDTTGPTFLRTGDLARVDAAGHILICGRMKDLIIVRGRNLYPQDVEFAVQEACDLVRPGCVAAFSTSELGGELEVVMEVRKSAEKDAAALLVGLEAMRRAVIAEGCYPSRLVAIMERTIPKTTSGKIQRRRSRELLHSGGLSVITELTAKVGALESTLEEQSEEQSEEPSSSSPTQSEPTPTSSAPPSATEESSADAPAATDSSATATSTSTSTSRSTPAALEDARIQRDNNDGVTAEHPQQEEEEEMSERPQHPKRKRVGSEAEAAGEDAGGLLERQRSERVGVLTDLVVATAGEVLRGLTISPDQALFDAGFDSLTAEEFVGRLQEHLVTGGWVAGGMKEAERAVSSTTVFDCPTARHMAEHVEGVLLGRVGATTAGGAEDEGTSNGMQNRGGDGDGSLAVVGIACRFPGGCDSPEAFWDFLRKGVDATSGVPSDRWSAGEAAPAAKDETRGAFLGAGEAWSFDNSFFGIPPAQASCMDPQQRMMLEVGYEALHRAGFTLDSLRGSDTGIFVGACGTDWATLLAQGEGPARGPYTSTGAAASMLANRLSFTLGTVGPSMTVDTACSSSLVALRQACLHLRDGEGASNGGRSRTALVGGVNLLLSPGPFDLFSKTGMLAPDGRSKAFSAEANGYGRGEGCGAVVLKRLEDARADGDRVFAVVKGSAVGHNGTSATITAPNGTSQRATISAALGEAGVAPGEVSYVEAHGTGTSLGDPVEFGALKAVYGTQRAAETPLVIGAVKSNIGHLEGAAGMSGLIKTILVLAHGAAPPNLHASKVNPRVDLSSLPAVLPREGGLTRLTRRRRQSQPTSVLAASMIDTPLVGGVSGGRGGGGGSNDEEEEGGQDGGRLVVGADGEEEVGVVGVEAEVGVGMGLGVGVEAAAGATSIATSTSSEFVVVDHDENDDCSEDQEPCPNGDGEETSPVPFYGGVSSFGFGGTNAHVVLAGQEDAFGKAEMSGPTPGVAFLFTGQGSQYPGMGREMYEDYDEFRAVVDECDEALKDVLPRRLVSVLYGGEKDAEKLLATTRYAQPALFAVECATAAALRAKGVTPSAVMGHSLGELAAACCAGVMTLREGVRLVAERGRLMGETSEGGGASSAGADGPECMAAVRSTERGASAAVESCGAGLVSLAAVNGPDSVVLSGPRRLVELVASAALSPQSPPLLPPPLTKGDMSAATAAAAVVAGAATEPDSSSSADGAQAEGGARGLAGVGGNRTETGTGLTRSNGSRNGSRYSDLASAAATTATASSADEQGLVRGRGGFNPSGFSTRHMSWLAGAKDAVPGKGVAGLDGSESTGSVSPSCDSVERGGGGGGGSDSGASSEDPLSDGALSDGPLSDGPLSDGPLTDSLLTDGPMTDGPLTDGRLADGPLTDSLLSDGPMSSPVVVDRESVEGFEVDGAEKAAGEFTNDQPLSNGQSRANGHPSPTSRKGTTTTTTANGHNLQAPSSTNGSISPAAAVDGATLVKGAAPANDSFAPTPSVSLNLPADRFRFLHGVSRAFHSPAMARSAAAVEVAAGKVYLRDPSIPLASNVTGRVAEDGELTDPSYWGKHVLQTVRFHDGLMALAGRAEGGGKIAPGAVTTFIEVGPSALLCGMGRRALQAATTVRGEVSSAVGKQGRVGGGGGGGGAGVTPSLRWIAAMSPDERVAGKRGLGHVVGAVRGVHYRRRLFPPTESPSKLPSAARTKMGINSETRSLPPPPAAAATAATAAQRRPPLRLLETRWVCLGDVSSGVNVAAVKDGDKTTATTAVTVGAAAAAVAVGGTPPATPLGKNKALEGKDGESDDDEATVPLGESAAESVWLLAGRTEASYAALRDAVSRADIDQEAGGQTREGGQQKEEEVEGERPCHMLTLGPSAAGGEAAAASRLKRLLRGGVGPDLNHVVYVVGGAVQAVGNEPINGSCIDGHGDRGAFQGSVGEFTSLLAFVKALVWAGKSSLRPLPEAVVVTRGVHACLDGDEVEGWSMSWLPGLLRSLAVEHPHLNIRHVDLPSHSNSSPQGQQDLTPSSAREMVEMLQAEAWGNGEPEVCLRGGKLFAPRLEEGRAVAVRAAGPQCHLTGRVSRQGAYVITGGTGGLGLELALRLARAGAGGLVLLSRRGEGFVEDLKAGSPRALAWKSLSRIHTTKVVVLRCDVTVADDVTNALFKAGLAGAGLPPVRGIVHAACPPQGARAAGREEDDAAAATATEDAEKRFMEAKVVGALNLTEGAARLGLELEFLVFFSSASAVLGLAGEAGYAAANGCLDGLAWRLKRCHGLKVLSVQYGPWVESGTATDRDGAVETLRAVGHLGVENDEGFSALGFLLGDVSSTSPDACSPPVSAVMPMEWGRYSSIFPTFPPLLGSMASEEALRGGRAGAGRGGAPWSRDEVVEVLLEAARQVTGWEGELGETLDLQEQVGMDSLQAVEFRRIICTQLGRNSIPTTLAYDCPTAGLMADELLRTAPAAAAATSSSSPSYSAKQAVPRTAPAATVAARGVSKPPSGVSGGGGRGGAGVGEGEAGEAGAEWEEERHLDNSLYLFYKLLRASLAYFYMACVVMLPAWVFFWGIRQAAPLGGVGLLIFVTLPLAWLVFGLCLCLLVVGSKWLLVGRVHPGESFNTHSVRHLLWWTTQRLQSFCGLLFVDEIRRGRLVVWYYRLLGARLGRDVFFNTVRISDPDLVSIGAGSTINEHADLSGHQIVGNRVVFGSGVTIGAGTVLLPSAYMAPEVQVGDGRIVGALATNMHPTRKNSTPLAPPTPLREVVLQVLADLVSLYAVAITVGLAAYVGFRSFSSMLELANIFPGEKMSTLGYGPLSGSNLAFGCYAAVFLLSRLYVPVLLVFGGANAVLSLSLLEDTVLGSAGLPLVLAVTAVSAVVFHVTHMVLSVCLKWILVQRFVQVDGVCRTTSWLGFRKQITDRLIMSAMMRSVLMFNGNLGNSLWLMALGGPVGRCVSVMLNKNIYTEAELLTLGDDMHVGFASSTYCSVYTAPNTFTLRKTFIGDRSLNGAGSVTLPGAVLPHGAALGPNTRLAATDAVREGALHLGSPAPVVAGRYQSPPRELSPFENVLYFGAPLPLAAMSTAVTLSAAFWPLLALARAAAALSRAGFGDEVVCGLAPLAWLGFGLSLGVTGAVAKWTIIGKQHPSDTKLWSLYHYRTLLVLYLQIHAHFLFVDILRRGRMFNTYARLLGASVGRDADVATMYFTDHDLVSIGDRAVVQEDCIPHPQFYFEGNMRFEPVSIAAGSNVGARSVLLGGATIKPNGSIQTLGLAAKASSRARGGNGGANSKAKP